MISKPYQIPGGWAVKITRATGKTYQVKSEDYQSILDYQEEFLTARQKRILQTTKAMIR